MSRKDRDDIYTDNFKIVAKEATHLACKSLLPRQSLETIATEKLRLQKYKTDWHSKAKLEDWIGLLKNDKLLPSESWQELADQIRAKDMEALKLAFSKVREEIQNPKT